MIEVRVPELGESISEVQVADWLRAEGDVVAVDDPIAEIDSDKATVELPAPAAGKLVEIKVAAGEFCKVGDLVALIDETAAGDGGGEAAGKTEATGSDEATDQAGSPDEKAAAPAADTRPEPGTDTEPPAGDDTAGGEGPVMPAAQRILDQAGIDAAQVRGTGPGGRVLKEDAQRAVAARREDTARQAPAQKTDRPAGGGAPAPATPAAPQRPAPTPAPTGSREERRRPMSPIRRRIAERLVDAQRQAALLTTFNEIDMTAVKQMRARHQDAFVARYGIKLGFMSFFTRAVIEGLRQVPQLNSEIRGQDIIERDFHDIGIAIGSGKGLVVPVIRNAELLGFGGLEQAIADFAERAQNKKLDLSELEGGTFTISNGGVYGSLLSTPIVNPPQSGVLGLHAIEDRPVVRDGEIVIRPMMYVALTYDHRLVDGREGVTFLRHVKDCIEAPERLMLEI